MDPLFNSQADPDGDGCVTYLDELILFPAIQIDIKPGSYPNSINPDNRGVVPVAILTKTGFDATTVPLGTVRFGPGGACPVHERAHLEDVDNDGDIDVVLHFKTQESGIRCGDTRAWLTGVTADGIVFEASERIQTAGCD
jgi:hypothetical protein